MVKLSGHRVELGEVEAVALRHPAIGEAAALVTDARLALYYTVRAGGTPSLLDVKRHCARHLPKYMVPHAATRLPELPRNANGKVDLGSRDVRAGRPAIPHPSPHERWNDDALQPDRGRPRAGDGGGRPAAPRPADPDRLAYRFLTGLGGDSESWTYRDLDARARAVAGRLQREGWGTGPSCCSCRPAWSTSPLPRLPVRGRDRGPRLPGRHRPDGRVHRASRRSRGERTRRLGAGRRGTKRPLDGIRWLATTECGPDDAEEYRDPGLTPGSLAFLQSRPVRPRRQGRDGEQREPRREPARDPPDDGARP